MFVVTCMLEFAACVNLQKSLAIFLTDGTRETERTPGVINNRTPFHPCLFLITSIIVTISPISGFLFKCVILFVHTKQVVCKRLTSEYGT